MERKNQRARYRQYWGQEGFILPHSIYGHWERALYDYDASLRDEQILQRKMDALRTLK